MLAVELSLAWGHLTDINHINTTGQLIPRVIGIFSLFPIMSETSELVLKKVRVPKGFWTTSVR